MKRICLHQLMVDGVPKRGPDIFFPMFFRHYDEQVSKSFELYYFIKTDNREVVLREFKAKGIDPKRVVFLDIHHSRFKHVLDNFQLLKKILRYRINLIQLATYSSPGENLHWLRFVQSLPTWLKPELAFTVTYNGIPAAFEQSYDARFEKDRLKYGQFFKEIKFKGILSWYDSFKRFTETHPLFQYAPVVYCVESRFCDSTRYFPGKKEKVIVWASALVNYKGPQMFLESISILKKENPSLLDGWKILIVGYGPMEEELRGYIQKHDLIECEMVTKLSDISSLLNTSMCYVSTQEIDNFPSLAMNEAMAAGNVIIARNVGRTWLFVEESKNGFLTPTDDAAGIATCLKKLLASETNREKMMQHSVELTKTKHTPENFIRQIDEFWSQLLNGSDK